MKKKNPKKYIKFLSKILSEIETNKGIMPKDHEELLKKKVIKYKNHLSNLDVTGKLNK